MNIYDIAAAAGVSIATVSRVLNNSPRVSEGTRRRVTAVMERERYVPNAFARGLGLNSMRMVGVMCTDVTDMFYAKAVGCTERFLKAQGMDILLCSSGSRLEDKKEKLAWLVSRGVDAVILIGSAFKEKRDNSHIKAAAEKLPVIIINGYIDLPNVCCVVCDERGAVRENVTGLVREGYRRLAYFYDAENYSGTEKLAGFREGAEECGLTDNDISVVRCEKSPASAKSEFLKLMSEGRMPQAVVASEDLLAAGVLGALAEKEITLPVIGFNNSVIAECTYPSLTSVDNMLEAMCETAVSLLERIGKNKTAPSKTVLSAELIERESYKRKGN